MQAKKWLKGCDLCNVAICDEMQRRIDEKKLSERKAAEEIATESNDFIGEIIYTTDAVLNRFRYYKRGRGGAKNPPPKKRQKAKPAVKPNPAVLGAMDRAKRAVEILQGIDAADPQFRDALYHVGNWINAQFEA